jgi:hypothetical protein
VRNGSKCIAVSSGRWLALDVVPPSNSPAARTEFSMITSTGDPLSVNLDANVSIMGTVMPQPMLYSPEAHVAVTIPSAIPGRAGLQITTDMASDMFMFMVGASRVMPGVPATLTFTPGASASQTQPPIPLPVDQLQPTLTLAFPTKEQLMPIIGQLVDDQNNPLVGYTVRAFYNDVLISNVAATASDGSFTLSIPPHTGPNEGPEDITFIMAPPLDTTMMPPAAELPQFRANPVEAKELSLETQVAPHVYTLPAFVPATAQPPFQFTVTANGQPQEGVTATFTMIQQASPDGNAYFQTSGMSDKDGLINVALVLGPGATPVNYQVMLQGPSDPTFQFASQCYPAVTVGLDPNGAAPAAVSFTLIPKVQLSGTVSDSMFAPAVGAMVTATQTSGSTLCGANATPPKPFQTISGSGGDYRMMVDPGTYVIDVDPPSNSMAGWPRLTLSGTDGVTLSGAMVRNIMLPPAQFIEGHVYGSDGVTPIAMATLQFFDVFCKQAPCGPTQAPVSLAQVQSDATGKFQAVIPMTLP